MVGRFGPVFCILLGSRYWGQSRVQQFRVEKSGLRKNPARLRARGLGSKALSSALPLRLKLSWGMALWLLSPEGQQGRSGARRSAP